MLLFIPQNSQTVPHLANSLSSLPHRAVQQIQLIYVLFQIFPVPNTLNFPPKCYSCLYWWQQPVSSTMWNCCHGMSPSHLLMVQSSLTDFFLFTPTLLTDTPVTSYTWPHHPSHHGLDATSSSFACNCLVFLFPSPQFSRQNAYAIVDTYIGVNNQSSYSSGN